MDIALIKSYTDKPWRSPETYQKIETSLQKSWTTHSIHTQNPETLRTFLSDLQKTSKGDCFVFNIAEFLDEENKTGFLPTLLEEWQIPHLGSTAKTIALGLDKAKTKQILLENHITTPQYFTVTALNDTIHTSAKEIGYPLIVKPSCEGGHIGISSDSIVHNPADLDEAIQNILETLHEPALVEEYIISKEMREFSVGIINCDPPLFLPIEIDFAAMPIEHPILSFEAAQKDLERTKLIKDETLAKRVIELSLQTFNVVGASDYSRVDLRMDDHDCYVLEINIMPGLGPHSFLPEAAQEIHNLDYAQFIQTLTQTSIQRQK